MCDVPALRGGDVIWKLAPGAADRRSRSVLPDTRATQLDTQCKVPHTPWSFSPVRAVNWLMNWVIHVSPSFFLLFLFFAEEFSNCWWNFSWKIKIILHTQVHTHTWNSKMRFSSKTWLFCFIIVMFLLLCTGLSFQDFYQRCREAFLVNSDLTLRTQLTEFRDHKLIRTRKVESCFTLEFPALIQRHNSLQRPSLTSISPMIL